MKHEQFDLTFVGAGLSCCCTTVYYINLAYELKKKSKVRLLIIEKTQEFWTGIPYGKRSGYSSLTITCLKEFLPENEFHLFVNWIRENFNKVVNNNKSKNGRKALNVWLLNNEKMINENSWEKLFIPRYLFGIYLKERVMNLLEMAKKDGIIDYKLLKAEVIDITKDGGLYNITTRMNNEKEILFSSTRVILSTGTPPKGKLNIKNNSESNQDVCIVEDIYDPDICTNISRIRTNLRKTCNSRQNNILVLGSNASALEILYNLKDIKSSENLFDQIYILSPDGAFPNEIKETISVTNYSPSNLTCLKNAASCTSEQILEAVQKDAEVAHKEKIDISDIYHPMSNLIIELLNKLDIDEQKKFVYRDGVAIGKFQRRAGAEYLESVTHLISKHKISAIKGRFLKQVFNQPNGFYFEYLDNLTEEVKTFPLPIKIVINCIGFQNLSNSSSTLIKSLIERNICLPNGSERGFEVNENFEANKNFYIIGPLLAGNLNKRLRIWHAESCPRIFHLSRQLAGVLIEDDSNN